MMKSTIFQENLKGRIREAIKGMELKYQWQHLCVYYDPINEWYALYNEQTPYSIDNTAIFSLEEALHQLFIQKLKVKE